MPPARIVFWAATLGGIGFAIYSTLTRPPLLEVAIACALAYGAVITIGVLFIGLRMFADAVVRGPEGVRGVALTFDDGPDPETTREVLDVLGLRGVKATFFVVAAKAVKHPEMVSAIVDGGHEIGVQSFAADRLFSLRGSRRVRADLERAVRTIEEMTEKRPVFFRPPRGHTNPMIARIADELDLVIVGWSVTRVDRGLEDGAIVLMHDAALGGVLDAIEAKNLTVVPLGDFITDDR